MREKNNTRGNEIKRHRDGEYPTLRTHDLYGLLPTEAVMGMHS